MTEKEWKDVCLLVFQCYRLSLHFISYSKDYNTEDWKVNVLQNKIKDERKNIGIPRNIMSHIWIDAVVLQNRNNTLLNRQNSSFQETTGKNSFYSSSIRFTNSRWTTCLLELRFHASRVRHYVYERPRRRWKKCNPVRKKKTQL